MEKICFMMTDTEAQVTKQCCAALQEQGVETAVCPKNGQEALNMLLHLKPDVALLDTFMPGLDAIAVKQRYEQQAGDSVTEFFVTGASQNEKLEQSLLDAGFTGCFLKPIDAEMLAERVRESVDCARVSRRSTTDEMAVTEVMHQIGVPAHIKGYQYLRDAILLTADDPEYINAVTKLLYPEIARRNNTTPSRVERAIRHAIEIAWDRGDVEILNRYFGYTIQNLRGKPTNSEFIAMIADHMRLRKHRLSTV